MAFRNSRCSFSRTGTAGGGGGTAARATAPDCPADLNGDLFVDDADFSLFVVAYNELLRL